MEKKKKIYGIQSKYILKNIFNLIPDKQFALKLLSHSKKFQKKLDINYLYCYKKYLDELHFDLNEYLYKSEELYEKGILRRGYENFITKNKLIKEKFEKIIYEVINKENEIIKENHINIDSPLFEILTKTKVLEKIYIYISQKNIDEYKLKEDYITIFNKLNNSNINYSSISYIFEEKTKLDYLKEISINFNNIRNLIFEYNGDEIINEKSSNDKINILNLFKSLEHLFFAGNENIIKVLENVNLKELKELYLAEIKISDIKILEEVKLDKLEILNIRCNKISDINILEKVNFEQLKELYLSYNKISDIKVLEKVKFDKLEILNLSSNEISDINNLENANFKF